MTKANKAKVYNNVLQLYGEEICNDERLAQLKGMPFMTIISVENVEHDEDEIRGIGGVTPAFKRMWESM